MAKKTSVGKEFGKIALVGAACAAMSYDSKQRKNALVKQQTVRPEPVYKYNGEWEFPQISGNFTSHNSWGSEPVNHIGAAIDEVLRRFKINYCCPSPAVQGATLTRIEVETRGATKVSAIEKLEKDLSVGVHSPGLTVNVEDGKIYIDIPREHSATVYLGDLLKSDEFKNAGKTALCIGMDNELHPVIYDLRDAVHVLIAGQTGSGKSVFMHTLIIGLLMKNTPRDIHLHIIDPKILEFSRYASLPHVTVTSEVSEAVGLLDGLCEEMERRYRIIGESGNRDIDSYNKANPDNPMRREVVIIDELSDLMKQSGKRVEACIVRLAQKARACGIHLIIATQYPLREVVTGLIKQNMPTKICLSVATRTASMVALDITGGEKLLGKGDMFFKANGALKPVRLQGGFVEEKEINNFINRLKENVTIVKQRKPYMPDKSKTGLPGALSIACAIVCVFTWMFWLCVPAVIGLTFAISGLNNELVKKPSCIAGIILNILSVVGFLAVFG